MIDFERRLMKHATRESRCFFFKVDKSIGRVLAPHNLVLGSSVAQYIASA